MTFSLFTKYDPMSNKLWKLIDREATVQITFTCSKSTIESSQKVSIMFKVNNKKYQNDVYDVAPEFLLLTLNIFHNFFKCFYC